MKDTGRAIEACGPVARSVGEIVNIESQIVRVCSVEIGPGSYIELVEAAGDPSHPLSRWWSDTAPVLGRLKRYCMMIQMKGIVLAGCMKQLLLFSIFSGALSAQTTVLGCIGDSITVGYASSPSVDPCLLEVNALNTLTGASNYSEGANIGIIGATSSDWASSISSHLAALTRARVSAVTIMLGTNDAQNRFLTPPATYYSNMQTVITALKGVGINHIVLNFAPYINGDPNGYFTPLSQSNSYIASYQTQIRALVAADPTHVFQGDTEAYTFFQFNPSLQADGLHPNNAGCALLANLWAHEYLGTETTGLVVYTGTEFDSGNAGCTPSCIAANVFDGTFTHNWFYRSQTGGNVGWNFGRAVWITAVRVSYSTIMSSGHDDVTGLQGSTIDVSANGRSWKSTFTYPRHPMIPRYWFQENAISPGAYRYIRFSSAWYGSVSQLEFIGSAGQGASTRPVEPVITPGGAVFPSGSVTVSMSSETTSAVMHYTTDGSTPTCSSTTYTGPVVITVGSNTVVNAIACDAHTTTAASLVSTGRYRNYEIKPADTEYDTAGHLWSFGDGSISKVGTTYYKIGTWAEKGNDPNIGPDLSSYDGAYIFSSTDLLNWTYVTYVPTPSSWAYMERSHIIYNVASSKYVLWGHCRNYPPSGLDRACVYNATSMAGPWTLITQSLNPDGFGYKDSSLFVDSDGVTAYVVYTNGAQNAQYISRLSSDYTSTVGSYLSVPNVGGREAPVLFKRNGTYFLINSLSNYYDASASFGVVWLSNTGASPITNSWSYPSNFFPTDPAGAINNGQPTSIINIGDDNWLYQSDHWRSTDLQSSTRVWFLLTFPTLTSVAPPSPLPTAWALPAASPGSRRLR